MSDWKRITKEVAFQSLAPNMVSAIIEHIQEYNLGPILSDVLMCVQTDSEKVKRGLFGKGETVRMGAVVTPRYLIWAIDDGKGHTTALSALLRGVVIMDYAKTKFAKMVPDSGMEVSGQITDVAEDGLIFIGLDEGTAGTRFKEIVLQAAQDAKK